MTLEPEQKKNYTQFDIAIRRTIVSILFLCDFCSWHFRRSILPCLLRGRMVGDKTSISVSVVKLSDGYGQKIQQDRKMNGIRAGTDALSFHIAERSTDSPRIATIHCVHKIYKFTCHLSAKFERA